MRSSPIASPFVSGLANFLKPYLMPIFTDELEKNLTHILSEDLLVTVVDLIADVYEIPKDADDAGDTKTGTTNSPSKESGTYSRPSSADWRSQGFSENHSSNNSEEESHEYHNSSCTTCDPSFKSTVESFLTYLLECFMLNFIDLDYFVKCFSRNREYIFLFFVDLLDVLVSELVEA